MWHRNSMKLIYVRLKGNGHNFTVLDFLEKILNSQKVSFKNTWFLRIFSQLCLNCILLYPREKLLFIYNRIKHRTTSIKHISEIKNSVNILLGEILNFRIFSQKSARCEPQIKNRIFSYFLKNHKQKQKMKNVCQRPMQKFSFFRFWIFYHILEKKT